MHVGTRHPIWQVIHESLHTRGSGLKTPSPATLIGSERVGAACRARPDGIQRRQSNMLMTGISAVSTPSTAFSSGLAGSTVAT